MPSVSSKPASSKSIRTAPQQERAERRLATILEVAGELFAEQGYEAVTMTEVAARSGSSIGALYNYFPDKQALALTLASRYIQDLETKWKVLTEKADTLSHAEFASRLIDQITDFVREHPAYPRLVAGPVRFRRDPAARKASRQIIAKAFVAKNPALSAEQAMMIANVTFQLIGGMMTLYAEAEGAAKDVIVLEFKKLLTAYLKGALSKDPPRL